MPIAEPAIGDQLDDLIVNHLVHVPSGPIDSNEDSWRKRPDMTDQKQRLLTGTLEYLATHGASEISLRRLAAALGTSHRMLIYHFGSKEGSFFELYGRAVQGDPCAAPLLDGIVESWLAPLSEWNRRQGIPPQVARSTACLGIVVARGLLLDLLATGDRKSVDAAMDQFLAMCQAVASRHGDISR